MNVAALCHWGSHLLQLVQKVVGLMMLADGVYLATEEVALNLSTLLSHKRFQVTH